MQGPEIIREAKSRGASDENTLRIARKSGDASDEAPTLLIQLYIEYLVGIDAQEDREPWGHPDEAGYAQTTIADSIYLVPAIEIHVLDGLVVHSLDFPNQSPD